MESFNFYVNLWMRVASFSKCKKLATLFVVFFLISPNLLISAPWQECGYTEFRSTGFNESKNEIHFGGGSFEGKSWPATTNLDILFRTLPFMHSLPEPTYKSFNGKQAHGVVYKIKVNGGKDQTPAMVCSGSGDFNACSNPGVDLSEDNQNYFSGSNEYIGFSGKSDVSLGSVLAKVSILPPPQDDKDVTCSDIQGTIDIEVIGIIFKAERYYASTSEKHGLFDKDGKEILVDGKKVEWVIQTFGGDLRHYGYGSIFTFEELNSLPREGVKIGTFPLVRHEDSQKPACSIIASALGNLKLSISDDFPANSCNSDFNTCSGFVSEDKDSTITAELLKPNDDKFAGWEGKNCPCDGSKDLECKFSFGKVKNEGGKLVNQVCLAKSSEIPYINVLFGPAAGFNVVSDEAENPKSRYSYNGFPLIGKVREGATTSFRAERVPEIPFPSPETIGFGRWDGQCCPCDGSTGTCDIKFDSPLRSNCTGGHQCRMRTIDRKVIQKGYSDLVYIHPLNTSFVNCSEAFRAHADARKFHVSIEKEICGKLKGSFTDTGASEDDCPPPDSPQGAYGHSFRYNRSVACEWEGMATPEETICIEQFGYGYRPANQNPSYLPTSNVDFTSKVNQPISDVIQKEAEIACKSISGKFYNYSSQVGSQSGTSQATSPGTPWTINLKAWRNVCCIERYRELQ